jgi:hypothetical protein
VNQVPVQLSLLDEPEDDGLSWDEWIRSLPPMAAEPEQKFGASAKVPEPLEDAA